MEPPACLCVLKILGWRLQNPAAVDLTFCTCTPSVVIRFLHQMKQLPLDQSLYRPDSHGYPRSLTSQTSHGSLLSPWFIYYYYYLATDLLYNHHLNSEILITSKAEIHCFKLFSSKPPSIYFLSLQIRPLGSFLYTGLYSTWDWFVSFGTMFSFYMHIATLWYNMKYTYIRLKIYLCIGLKGRVDRLFHLMLHQAYTTQGCLRSKPGA